MPDQESGAKGRRLGRRELLRLGFATAGGFVAQRLAAHEPILASPSMDPSEARSVRSGVGAADEAVDISSAHLADAGDPANGDALIGVRLGAAGSVATTQHEVNQRLVSALDFMTDAQRTDWLTGAGLIDATAAINAATAYARSVSRGSLHAPWADKWELGGAVVQLPPGKGLISGTINWYDNVTIRGAGKRSTMIHSSHDGVLFANINTNYGCYEGGVSSLSIMGDRTKANQVGLKMTRQWFGTFDDLEVYGCGGDGVQLFECLQVAMNNLESLHNVGNGLYVSCGLTAGRYPTNNCVFINGHFGFNDAAGIKSVGQVNGCQWIGGSAEGNYLSGGNNVGYNIEWTSTDMLPSEFMDMWVEGPVKAHVRVAIPNSGNAVRFTRLHHASNGPTGNVDRAVIVESGICFLDGAYGTNSLYRTISGSSVPFRVHKSGTGAILYARDCWGSLATGSSYCEDEANLTTGLTGRYWFDNQRYLAGTKVFFCDSGQIGVSAAVTGEPHAWWQLDNHLRGMSFGSGRAAPDARIRRSAANTLAMDTGHWFDQGSAWNGNHVLMGAFHLWVDASGQLRIKKGAPTSDTDGATVGTRM